MTQTQEEKTAHDAERSFGGYLEDFSPGQVFKHCPARP